jgi:hypothetical protein
MIDGRGLLRCLASAVLVAVLGSAVGCGDPNLDRVHRAQIDVDVRSQGLVDDQRNSVTAPQFGQGCQVGTVQQRVGRKLAEHGRNRLAREQSRQFPQFALVAAGKEVPVKVFCAIPEMEELTESLLQVQENSHDPVEFRLRAESPS